MPKKVKLSSSAQILGSPIPTPKKSTLCVVCSKQIPVARIAALELLNTPSHQYTHVACSTTTKIKGIYSGEVGTSKIILCNKVYNDSVRTVFKRADLAEDEDESSEEGTEEENQD